MLITSTVAFVLLAPMIMAATSGEKWALAWHDEFNGPTGAEPNRQNWAHDLGGNGWGNHELEEYTDQTSNASLDGHGHLVIRAIQTAPHKYTSARLKTDGHFEARYGRIEARIKIPAGQGLWPAFWMLGNNISSSGWPGCGEIDIMENIGKEPDTVHGTIHGPDYAGDKAITHQFQNKRKGSLHRKFHIYGVEWSPERIIFQFDRTQYATVTRESLPAGAKWVFDHPFYLLLNLAVGGDWPGNPDSSTPFPDTMLVDWVRVWQEAGSKEAVRQPATFGKSQP